MTVAAASAPVRRLDFGTALGMVALATMGVFLVVTALSVLVVGAPYYLLDEVARVEHWLHPWLRSGGFVGLWLGVGGAALMSGILVYRVRKLLGIRPWLGSMTWWLRFHLMCGVLGPVLIILHGGLTLPSGFIAVAFWCMILVAMSGVFGRFIYGHIPKGAAGRELQLDAARKNLSVLRADLVAGTADTGSSRELDEALALARDLDQRPTNIVGLIRLDLEVRRRRRKIAKALGQSNLPKAQRELANTLLIDQLLLKRNLEGWEVTGRLFRYWHLFHRPLATAMYLLVALHILSAILLGGAVFTLFGVEA